MEQLGGCLFNMLIPNNFKCEGVDDLFYNIVSLNCPVEEGEADTPKGPGASGAPTLAEIRD